MTRSPRPFLTMVATAALAGVALSGCAGTDRASDAGGEVDSAQGATRYPLTVDDCEGERTFDTAPTSVLTIGTAAVSLLDAAGASSKVVARSGEFGSPLPDGLADRPTKAKMLDDSDPSAEAILSSGAELVYGYGLFNAQPEQVEQAGIDLLTVQGECGHDGSEAATDAVTLETVTDDIRRLGRVFDTADAADAAAGALDTRVRDLTVTATDRTAAWVYFFSSSDPVSAYGSASIAHDVLGKAGLANIYATEKASYLETSVESLLESDPDWVVLSYGLYGESEAQARQKFLSLPGVSDLSAVRDDRIVMVPGASSQPSPEAVDGLEAVITATADAG